MVALVFENKDDHLNYPLFVFNSELTPHSLSNVNTHPRELHFYQKTFSHTLHNHAARWVPVNESLEVCDSLHI